MVTAHAYGAVADSGKKRIDVFLVLVYIFSILIDLYNGYAQLVLEQETVIPLLYKGGMLIYCMFFIFRNSTVLKYAYVFVLCYLCCVGYWVVSGYSLTLMGVIDDLSRLVYPYVILAYFITRKSDMDKMLLLRYMMYGCLLAALVIVITSLLGVGISSYGSDYGYGSKGFFRAGNDISLLLVMGNTIVSYFLTVRSRLIYIIYGGIIAAACMMIGTTAGIIGAFANYVFLVLQLVLVRGRYTWMYKLFCVGMLVFGVPFLLNWTKDIVNTDAYTMQKFDVERILSGENRNFLKDAYMNVQEDFTFGDRVFGLGYQELGRRIGADLGLGASRVSCIW